MTKWTPALVAERLNAAHARWREEDRWSQRFSPGFLEKIGQRQVYGQNRKNGVFAAGLALTSAEVRSSWQARGRRPWSVKFCAARLQELFAAWRIDARHGRPAGKPWSARYVNAVDHSFLRTAQRRKVRLDALVKRIGGELRFRWKPLRPVSRRPQEKRRTIRSAARALAAAHRRWLRDEVHGKPVGKRFGAPYLRQAGEERLDVWIRRHMAITMVLAFAPDAVAKDWVWGGSLQRRRKRVSSGSAMPPFAG